MAMSEMKRGGDACRARKEATGGEGEGDVEREIREGEGGSGSMHADDDAADAHREK